MGVNPRPDYWPDWWSPEVYRQSCEAFELMTHCDRCKVLLEDNLSYKLCPRCRTAYSPVVDYERLEREIIIDALAGEDP